MVRQGPIRRRQRINNFGNLGRAGAMRPIAVIRPSGKRPLAGAKAAWRAHSGSDGCVPYLNSGTRSFTLAPVEAGLLPAGTSCCRGRASILLRGTEAPQRAARGSVVRRRGVGTGAGAGATAAAVRRLRMD